MLLSKQVQNIEVARTSANGTRFWDGTAVAEATGRRLIRNAKADELFQSGNWTGFEQAFPTWTGTLVAYPAPGRKFGVIIDIIDEAFRYYIDTHTVAGKGGMAIILESGTYEVYHENSLRIIVPKGPVVEMEFPQSNGQVHGPLLDGYVIRSDEGGIFAAVRDCDISEHAQRRKTIRLSEKFSSRFGVLLEGAYGAIPPKPVDESYLHASGGD